MPPLPPCPGFQEIAQHSEDVSLASLVKGSETSFGWFPTASMLKTLVAAPCTQLLKEAGKAIRNVPCSTNSRARWAGAGR